MCRTDVWPPSQNFVVECSSTQRTQLGRVDADVELLGPVRAQLLRHLRHGILLLLAEPVGAARQSVRNFVVTHERSFVFLHVQVCSLWRQVADG